MKKIISLLLALLMAFSVVTVAFAESDTTVDLPEISEDNGTEGEGEESSIDLGEYQWILDLPFWTVKPALKFAKIAFKLVSVYLKVGKIFGVVEQDMDDIILGAISDLIDSSLNSENAEDTTVEPETTAAVAA